MKLKRTLPICIAAFVLCFAPSIMAQTLQTTGNTDTGSTSSNSGSGDSQAGAGNIINNGSGAGATNGGTGGTDGGAGGAGQNGGAGGAGGQGGSATGGDAKSTSKSNSTAVALAGSRSSANNNGNVNIETPRQTATAIAPNVYPTVPCFKGIGVAGQGPAFGFSFGGGKVDQNCTILETARSFAAVGNRLAYCKVMLTDKYVKKAGVTMEDCMFVPEAIAVEVAAPVVQAAPTIIVNVPPITVAAPAAEVIAPPVVIAPRPRIHRKRRVNPCPTSENDIVTNDVLACLVVPEDSNDGE